MQHVVPDQRGAVAAQLYEAATSALAGDGEVTKARIARAIALLHGEYDSAPVVVQMPQRKSEIARGGLAPWQVRRITAYVEENLAGSILLADLAKIAGLSDGHFSRAFKTNFGQSAHAYVVRRRIEVAQGLMLTTSEPLSQIALACGMSDQPHFTRLFRRVVGETPSAWRRAHRVAIAA